VLCNLYSFNHGCAGPDSQIESAVSVCRYTELCYASANYSSCINMQHVFIQMKRLTRSVMIIIKIPLNSINIHYLMLNDSSKHEVCFEYKYRFLFCKIIHCSSDIPIINKQFLQRGFGSNKWCRKLDHTIFSLGQVNLYLWGIWFAFSTKKLATLIKVYHFFLNTTKGRIQQYLHTYCTLPLPSDLSQFIIILKCHIESLKLTQHCEVKPTYS
jgi:hypothetical protein